MKKLILIVLTVAFAFILNAQNWETIGSGVANFLLSNPTTANRMNPTEQAGLTIIEGLLHVAGKRKHEINVANAGRTQLNYQTSSGQQLELVMDPDGGLYIRSGGLAIPLSRTIVAQARGKVVSEEKPKEGLTPYDLNELESEYPTDFIVDGQDKKRFYKENAVNLENSYDWRELWTKDNIKIKNTSQLVLEQRRDYLSEVCLRHGVSRGEIKVNYRYGPYMTLKIQGGGKYLSEIAEKYNVKTENIYIIGYRVGNDREDIKMMMSNNLQTLTNKTVITIYFDAVRHVVRNKEGEYISEICEKYGVSPSQVEIISWGGNETKSKIANMLYGQMIIKKGTVLMISKKMPISINPIKESQSESKIKTSFTCNWYIDFRGDGLDFQDFQGVKNSFYEKERINLICIYQTNEKSYFLSLKIYNTLNGELITSRDTFVLENVSMYSSWKQELESNNLEDGEYMFNFKLFTTEKILDSRTGRFEIISSQVTSSEESKSKTPITTTSTKEDQINRLIKLFESGKISEITFNNSMRTLEK